MFKKIPLHTLIVSTTGQTSYGKSVDLEKIAEELGLNVNMELRLLYAGNNNTTGIQFYDQNDASIQMKFLMNGTAWNTFYVNISCNNDKSYLYYKKSNNGVVFGVNSSGTACINICIAKAEKLTTGEIDYIYIGQQVNTGGFNVMNTDGVPVTISGSLTNTDENIISLAPIVIPSMDAKALHVYMAVVFRATEECMEFEMNGKQYVSPAVYTPSLSRFIFEL